MQILVLGANGFVGRRIVAAIIAKLGAEAVIAGVRRPATFPQGVEQRIVDATSEASLMRALPGVTHIINSVMGTNQAIVESARATAAMIDRDPALRLVQLSSISVYGNCEGVIHEDAAPGTPADGYAAAKIEAERLLQLGTSRRFVLLRPGLIYGPGSYLWTVRIAALLKSGRLGDLGQAGKGLCNLVHVDDVAAAAVGACVKPGVEGRAFNLVAPSPPSWNRYLTEFAQALGLPPRHIPGWQLQLEKIAAYPLKVAQIVGGKLGKEMPEPITPGLARLFGQKVIYESEAASALLSRWTDTGQGIAATARSIG